MPIITIITYYDEFETGQLAVALPVARTGETAHPAPARLWSRRSTTFRTLYPLHLARSSRVPRRDFSLVSSHGFTLNRMCSQFPLRSEKYPVDAPNARRLLVPDRTSRSRRGSAFHRYRARRAALRLRQRRSPCQGVTTTRPTGGNRFQYSSLVESEPIWAGRRRSRRLRAEARS